MYIHKSICISPQHTFRNINLEEVVASAENKLTVIEPRYENIPLNTLRRMGKGVRMSVGAASSLLNDNPLLNGIVIGTANGGMEDCIKFLNQIIQYDEGTLTPTNFVQSTNNAIAAQIGLNAHNNQYNITHVHRGLAFENAMLDVMLLTKENSGNTYLLGGVDEISTYNFNLEKSSGAYKREITSNLDLYKTQTSGSIAGEGVAMFLASDIKNGAVARVSALKTLHTDSADEVVDQLKIFLQNNLQENHQVDIFLSGENGDQRLNHFYASCEALFDSKVTMARFKHLCGEYPTAASFAVWLSSVILESQHLPQNVLKNSFAKKPLNRILIYNSYKGLQHSFILIEKP